jgi:ketosteroid isomerase-like protein
MTDRSILENTVKDFYEARAERDLERTMSFVHPECCFRIAGTDKLAPFTQTVRTRPSINEAASALFEAWDLKGLRTVEAFIDGNVVVAHRAGSVIHRPTGESFDTEMMDKFVFKDGQVAEYLQFIDTYQVAKTAGFG